MRLSTRTVLPLLLPLLPTLVASDACVVGGPATAVNAAKSCCLYTGAGTWYQFYSVQAICVMAADRVNAYSKCVNEIRGELDTRCIPGNGGVGGVGLTSGGVSATPTLTTSAGQVTFTARRF